LLRFFKNNSPVLIIVLLVLLVALRLPTLLQAIPMYKNQLNWMLLGEAMASGSTLYADIDDPSAPFSGLVYMFNVWVSGRSLLFQQYFVLFISIIQILFLSVLAHQKKFFNERNYVPGLLLVLFYCLSYEFQILSPALLGLLFILLAFRQLIGQIETSNSNEETFRIGAYISVAGLFFTPYFLWILWAVLSIYLFTKTKPSHVILMFLGFVFPILFTAIWFYINANMDSFVDGYLLAIFKVKEFAFNDLKGIFFLFLVPLVLALLGFLVAANSNKYNNFQTRMQQVVILWFLTAIVSSLLMPYISPMNYMVLAYPLVHFMVIFFENFKKYWQAELVFSSLVGFALFLNFTRNPAADTRNIVDGGANTFELKGKKILVLGKDNAPYLNNVSGSPFINWNLSGKYFKQLDNYSNVVLLIKTFEKYKPEYIIDQENLMPLLSKRIPSLGKQYVATRRNRGVYQLKL
jgi:hypothetical protein